MLWYKVKKAQFKLFCAKASKEIKKLAIAVVLGEMLVVGCYYYITSVNYWGLFDSKTITVYVQEQTAKVEAKDNISVLADKIWFLESTRGKNNYSKCEAIGQVNGIGYGIYNGKYMCFENHVDEMETLKEWLQKKLASGLTERQALCLYNTGLASDDCKYIR